MQDGDLLPKAVRISLFRAEGITYSRRLGNTGYRGAPTGSATCWRHRTIQCPTKIMLDPYTQLIDMPGMSVVGPTDHHLRTKFLQAKNVRKRHPRVGYLRQSRHVLLQIPVVRGSKMHQQCLGGMFMGSVAGIDNVRFHAGPEDGRSGHRMPHDDDVDFHRQDVVHRIDKRFSFAHRGGGSREN